MLVSRQQLKHDIKRVIVQHLRERGVLAGSSPAVDGRSSGLGKWETGGAVWAEGSEAKAALPPFEPFSLEVMLASNCVLREISGKSRRNGTTT